MKITRRDFAAAVVAGGAFSTLHVGEANGAESPTTPAIEPICPPGRMRFQLLGSSGGKPVPRPFCLCHACEQARKKGGRNCRTRTSMNLYAPGDVLGQAKYRVDLSSDVMYHLIQNHLDETALAHLLFTHDHSDHCDPEYLGMRSASVSPAAEMKPLHVHGSEQVEKRLRSRVNLDRCKIEFHRIDPFQEATAGALKVHSLQANHGSPGCLNYIVQTAGLTALLAWDTGLWSEETWKAASRFHFDAVFLECTVAASGGRESGSQHLNPETFMTMKNRMAELGLLKPAAPFVSVHIGDNGRRDHDELQALWSPHGVTVGYDGMLVEIGRGS
jgi:phosphoribosyl 1,2-cyclic phosphate phosphodiesterase